MRKLRLYLDTSVINFVHADDEPEKRDATVEFFEKIVVGGVHEAYVSSVVLDEIERTPDAERRGLLLGVIQRYALPMAPFAPEQEIRRLASLYMSCGVIPAAKLDDALHVAIATVHEMDALVTWNFRHLANLSRESRIVAVNLTEGYNKYLRLVVPIEVQP